MMSSTVELDAALKLALRLMPLERLRLVELVVASVGQDISETPQIDIPVGSVHWGKSLNQLLDTLDLKDWEQMDMDDPVAWVAAIRAQNQSRLDRYWNGEQ
jgi:hypothetical protein